MTRGNMQSRLRQRHNYFRNYAKPTEPRGTKQGYIYAMGMAGSDMYKLGRTGNITARLADLRAGNPALVAVIACRVRDCRKSEKAIHHKFNRKNIEREWYRLTSDDLAWIRKYLDKASPAVPETPEEQSA